MQTLHKSNVFYFFLGITLTLAATGMYWQIHKQEFAKKMLSGLTQGELCTDDTLESEIAIEKDTEEVYFVGCGGFF